MKDELEERVSQLEQEVVLLRNELERIRMEGCFLNYLDPMHSHDPSKKVDK